MKLICDKCDYKWEYTGELDLATCPNCNHKVKTRKNKTKEEA